MIPVGPATERLEIRNIAIELKNEFKINRSS